MPDFTLKQWKYILLVILIVDLLVVGGILRYAGESAASQAAVTAVAVVTTPPTATASPTPWPGPGPRPTATPTLPPTPSATPVLADGGFPMGFTPTPRPTRAAVYITLPQIFSTAGRRWVDVPVVNQIYYPEPFFPPGSNNACGPVALYAGLQGLGLNVDYSRLRDVAVSYGFDAEGISKAGLVNTAVVLNQEMGNRLQIEQGNIYSIRSLMKHLGQGSVVIVLVRVKKEYGSFVVTADQAGSFGHFLLVERINLKTRKVRLAGSTLGMEQVPLADFIRSWSGNSQAVGPTASGIKLYLEKEKAANWALILKRS